MTLLALFFTCHHISSNRDFKLYGKLSNGQLLLQTSQILKYSGHEINKFSTFFVLQILKPGTTKANHQFCGIKLFFPLFWQKIGIYCEYLVRDCGKGTIKHWTAKQDVIDSISLGML